MPKTEKRYTKHIRQKMKKRFFKVQTISVYISTTLVLLLLGIMGILFIGAKSLSKSVQENLLVTVVISDKLDDSGIDRLKKNLENDKRVLRSTYISKEQALEEETRALRANPAEILGYNPYEASMELTLKPEYSNTQEVEKFEQLLLKNKGVKEVIYQKDLIDTINENIQHAGIMLLALLAMLTLISWSLIGNLVRLSIYSKRFLLHTMKLVGATWGFICRPFIFRNMWIGFFSGVVANAILATGIYFIDRNELEIITFLPITELIAVAAGVILFGMTICMLCAFLSVLRFLRMRKNDLYFI